MDKDQGKTKEQLIVELAELRQKVGELEANRAGRHQARKELDEG